MARQKKHVSGAICGIRGWGIEEIRVHEWVHELRNLRSRGRLVHILVHTTLPRFFRGFRGSCRIEHIATAPPIARRHHHPLASLTQGPVAAPGCFVLVHNMLLLNTKTVFRQTDVPPESRVHAEVMRGASAPVESRQSRRARHNGITLQIHALPALKRLETLPRKRGTLAAIARNNRLLANKNETALQRLAVPWDGCEI